MSSNPPRIYEARDIRTNVLIRKFYSRLESLDEVKDMIAGLLNCDQSELSVIDTGEFQNNCGSCQ